MALRDLFLVKATNTMDTYVSNVCNDCKDVEGISPAIIAAIIAFVAQMIGKCPTPPTPAQVIAGGGFWGQFVLNRAVREVTGIRPMSKEGQKLITAMQAQAAHLSEGDANLFLAMAQAS